MDIFKIVLIAILAVSMIIIVKQTRPEIAMLISIITVAFIFLFSIDKVGQVIELITKLSDREGLSREFLSIILKIVGIAYITEFGANICKDIGESAIAAKVQFAGKCVILIFGINIIGNFVDTLTQIL